MALFITVALLSSLGLAQDFPVEDGVFVITQDTFLKALMNFPVWMLEVYAPW